MEILYGSFKWADAQLLYWVGPLFVFLYWRSFYLGKKLVLLSWDADFASQMKVDPKKILGEIILWAWPASMIVMGTFGPFFFVGLIFPIAWRELPWIGKRADFEMLWSPLLSGFSLMLLDGLCYFFPIFGAEIPVGLTSSLLGPVMLAIFLWKKLSTRLGPV